jgi:hypothetical protein
LRARLYKSEKKMRRFASNKFCGLVMMVIVMALSGCETPAPAVNVPTATIVPQTIAVVTPTVPPSTPTATLGTADSGTPTGTSLTSPITGSVLVEGGNSVAGGVTGDTIELQVTFEAESTAGTVTDMRVDAGMFGGCMREEDMAGYPWQPFMAEQVYTTTAFINFQGWYVSAQYRDSAGNVSRVYCDDISIEGMPPTP